MFKFKGETIETSGKLIKMESTSASINKQNVQEFKFSFIDQNGVKHNASSYGYYGDKPKTEDIIIEYLTNNPEVSRIKGMKREIFDKEVAFYYNCCYNSIN